MQHMHMIKQCTSIQHVRKFETQMLEKPFASCTAAHMWPFAQIAVPQSQELQ